MQFFLKYQRSTALCMRNVKVGSLAKYVGKNVTTRRKGVRTKSKGYKLDGMVLMVKKKHKI